MEIAQLVKVTCIILIRRLCCFLFLFLYIFSKVKDHDIDQINKKVNMDYYPVALAHFQ